MAVKHYKDFRFGMYLLMLIIILLVYDFYINFQTLPDVWNSEWLKWRVLLVVVIVALVIMFFVLKKIQKARIKQLEFTEKIILAQEREWKRIAAELHDNIGQNLTFLNNQILQIANLTNGEGRKEELLNISKNLIITVDEIRSIMSNIYPHQLERLGFKKAVESLIGKVSSGTGLVINSEIENIGEFILPEYLINLYRIVQEALNNIIKHSGAKTVTINLYSDSQFIYLNVEDDGMGFSAGNDFNINFGSGYGIEFMHERVRIIGGKIRIDSRGGQGTKIHIIVPKKIYR